MKKGLHEYFGLKITQLYQWVKRPRKYHEIPQRPPGYYPT